MGYCFKKTLKASEQNRMDVAESRANWQNRQAAFDVSKLVFLDESAAKTNMIRLYGRILIGLIRLNKETTCLAMSGGTTGEVFREYVRQILAPRLSYGDIVIADDLGTHKNQKAKELIEAAGASIIFLPPYSPDFNPVEKMWSKIKQSLRPSFIRRPYL